MEASSLFPTAFSSQDRCIVPTKSYALASGYGCFAYIPLFWYEEARVVNNQSMYQIYDHYYTRPGKRFSSSIPLIISHRLPFYTTERANTLILSGIVIGAGFVTMGIFLYINEAYYRRRFYSRVYVD